MEAALIRERYVTLNEAAEGGRRFACYNRAAIE
jgi:hypothetical protein